jgi:hypothetical protein
MLTKTIHSIIDFSQARDDIFEALNAFAINTVEKFRGAGKVLVSAEIDAVQYPDGYERPGKCCVCEYSERYAVNQTMFVGTVKCNVDAQEGARFKLVAAHGRCFRFKIKQAVEDVPDAKKEA